MYSSEQFNLLTSSLLGNEIFQIRTIFEEEYSILNQKVLTKQQLDYDEYFKYRQFTLSKGNNITGLCSLIPFVDILNVHPTKYNLKLEFNLSDYGVKVISTKKIKPRRKLMVQINSMPNSNLLIFYGKTFQESEKIITSFLIPYFSPFYLNERNIDQSLAIDKKLDLVHEKFYEEAMPTYMQFSKKIKEDGSPLSALNIFKGNLMALRKKYDEVTTSILHKTFFTLKDVENVKRILNTEMRFYDEKMKVIDVLIDYTINNKTKNENKEKEDNFDL